MTRSRKPARAPRRAHLVPTAFLLALLAGYGVASLVSWAMKTEPEFAGPTGCHATGVADLQGMPGARYFDVFKCDEGVLVLTPRSGPIGPPTRQYDPSQPEA